MTTPLPVPPSLLDRLRAADADALGEVYQREGAVLLRTASWLTGSTSDGEDVVQDLFVGLPDAIGSYNGTGDLGAWLRRIVVRMALMRLRSERRRRQSPAEAAETVPASGGGANAITARLSIDTALRALSDDLRVVFILKEIEGYSHAEIATRLGIEVNTAQVRLHRARRALRVLLEDAR
jgi:RNA polymerase sigma-70 factor (ECF subfamily)